MPLSSTLSAAGLAALVLCAAPAAGQRGEGKRAGGDAAAVATAESCPKLLAKSYVTTLDARTAAEFAASHVAGAVNIGSDHAREALDGAKARGVVAVYSWDGDGRSRAVAAKLAAAGFETADLGGLVALTGACEGVELEGASPDTPLPFDPETMGGKGPGGKGGKARGPRTGDADAKHGDAKKGPRKGDDDDDGKGRGAEGDAKKGPRKGDDDGKGRGAEGDAKKGPRKGDDDGKGRGAEGDAKKGPRKGDDDGKGRGASKRPSEGRGDGAKGGDAKSQTSRGAEGDRHKGGKEHSTKDKLKFFATIASFFIAAAAILAASVHLVRRFCCKGAVGSAPHEQPKDIECCPAKPAPQVYVVGYEAPPMQEPSKCPTSGDMKQSLLK